MITFPCIDGLESRHQLVLCAVMQTYLATLSLLFSLVQKNKRLNPADITQIQGFVTNLDTILQTHPKIWKRGLIINMDHVICNFKIYSFLAVNPSLNRYLIPSFIFKESSSPSEAAEIPDWCDSTFDYENENQAVSNF